MKQEDKDTRSIGVLFEIVRKELIDVRIPISSRIASVQVNNRPRARLGCCKKNSRLIGKTVYTIEISRFVLDMEQKKIKEVIAHELLHTCPGCFNHGYKWKQYAALLNKAYGYEITRTTKLTEEISNEKSRRKEEYKYILRCTNCGQLFKRKRICNLTRHPEKYRCRKCGGSIKREEQYYI